LIKKLLLSAIIVTVACAAWIYNKSLTTREPDVKSIDLDKIRERGKLIAVTDFNSTDYFIYKGTPMGFNYELLNSFSDFLGLDLEIVAENNMFRAQEMVRTGEADLLASGLVSEPEENRALLLSSPIDHSNYVLVQRKPSDWKNQTDTSLEKSMIRDLRLLKGKLVYTGASSSAGAGIFSINKSIGGDITIIRVPFDSEKLIKLVASGEIDYAVCDGNVARVNSTYYPGIDVKTIIGEPFDLSWCVRKDNSGLLISELNRWINSCRSSDSYALLHAKYFNNSWSSIIVKSDFYSLSTGKVSKYDDLIRKFSSHINWDWRLLASLICQESQFHPDVVSGTGAYGLMQVMPVTGRTFGIDIKSSPENNIKAGILYIEWLNALFTPRIPDRRERLNFILASYNAGPGHVLDAMRLAEKNGMDPVKWEGNVALWLARKSEPQYYNDAVVKNGYFRGLESVRFVTEVMGRFGHYRNIIPEEKSRPYGE
jgi:membrane-bound lytic murein transglycosylase F